MSPLKASIIGAIIVFIIAIFFLWLGYKIGENKHQLPIKDSISFDMYRGISVPDKTIEPIYIDTNTNIYKATDTVIVNNTSHCVLNIEHDDTSNSHLAIIGIFIKRIKFADEGEDNQ